jgi:hypothetical protein
VNCLRTQFGRTFDSRMAFLDFKTKKLFIILEDADAVARFLRDQRLHQGRDFSAIELTVGETGAHHFSGKPANFLIGLHEAS